MEASITYFDKADSENTNTTLNIAKKRADELGIKTILVASTVGDTAVKAVDIFEGSKVIAVGHVTGMREPNKNEFTEENKKKVESKGGVVLFTGHAFTGLTRRPGPPPAPGTPPVMPTGPILEVGEIIANSLRILCAGIKVVVEIGAMAADAGLVPVDEDIIAIAGSGRGADTAVVMRAANSSTVFRTQVKEILCKPHSPAVRLPGPPPSATAGGPRPGN